jgi:hypothetical protein
VTDYCMANKNIQIHIVTGRRIVPFVNVHDPTCIIQQTMEPNAQ